MEKLNDMMDFGRELQRLRPAELIGLAKELGVRLVDDGGGLTNGAAGEKLVDGNQNEGVPMGAAGTKVLDDNQPEGAAVINQNGPAAEQRTAYRMRDARSILEDLLCLYYNLNHSERRALKRFVKGVSKHGTAAGH